MPRRGGWRRLGRKGRFRYEDAHGNRVTDEEALERVASLAIPPAWRAVWISPNPGAKLQATGVDAAGRRQYLYHPRFRAAQERRKYERLVEFGGLLPGLRSRMVEHLALGPYEHEWACAVALSFVNRAWFRVGSERHARSTRSYGVTTLHKRHAAVRGDRVTFRFRGKHRALVRTTIVDAQLAEAVRDLLAYPGGSRLFRFQRNGGPAVLTGPLLNAYVGEHLGEGFTTKDFRTWGGTLTAAIALAEHEPPETELEERRILAAVMRRVGEELGNTAAVARASYVSPAVIEQWREGNTVPPGLRTPHLTVVQGRTAGLLPEERALLKVLRSWHGRRARAA
jgi:DNA topoisomerase I